MASSFVGYVVQMTLTHGGSAVVGTIVNVDPVTQTLSVRDSRTGQVVELTRDRIGGLQLIEQAPAASGSAPVPHQAQAQPSVLSLPDVGQLNVAPVPSPQPHQHQQPKAPPALKTKPKRNGAESPATPARSYVEDFDFEANLNQFDKKKIWQEIRSADKSDPTQLLVSHNRAATPVHLLRGPDGVVSVPISKGQTAAQPEPAAAGRKRHAQEKLGLFETVLGESFSPRPEPASVPHRQAGADATIQALETQLSLLQALSGMTLAPVEKDVYEATMWRDHTSQQHAQETGDSAGSLQFRVLARAPSTRPSVGGVPKLDEIRYLGPATSANAANRKGTDPEVLQALPAMFKSDVLLRNETASIFVRRLRTSAFP